SRASGKKTDRTIKGHYMNKGLELYLHCGGARVGTSGKWKHVTLERIKFLQLPRTSSVARGGKDNPRHEAYNTAGERRRVREFDKSRETAHALELWTGGAGGSEGEDVGMSDMY
ncbi:MAG: hypothetical protein Q9204_004007, partial [Flavoplaca sp. TL-2023a]